MLPPLPAFHSVHGQLRCDNTPGNTCITHTRRWHECVWDGLQEILTHVARVHAVTKYVGPAAPKDHRIAWRGMFLSVLVETSQDPERVPYHQYLACLSHLQHAHMVEIR